MQQLITDIPILTLDQNELRTEPDPSQAGGRKTMYIESYGCQMNFSDSEIVTAVMRKAGYARAKDPDDADVLFINTCSIREKAEQTVRNRLAFFNSLKKNRPGMMIGVLGCMAERLKKKLLEEEKMVDIVVGPDAYRDLPGLVKEAEDGRKAVNTFLSREETYADISPVRLDSNGVTAFISIMRGCDNMCSFCVVPFTRGRERSRDPRSIVREASALYGKGYREVTLLGQNVDSYHWSGNAHEPGGRSREINFAALLEMVAQVHPDLRVRFSTSHPKDMTDEVLLTMKRYQNICKYIHLPAQSGSTRVLGKMNRSYSREWYLARIKAIRDILGEDCGISSDLIAGFCTETEEEHRETLSLMQQVNYDFAYMFMYSERPGTPAAKKLRDDVPADVKKRRLQEIIDLQRAHSEARNRRDIGKTFRVLVEGPSKRSEEHMQGRNTANKVVVFPREDTSPGDYVLVYVKDCTGATLLGDIVGDASAQRVAL